MGVSDWSPASNKIQIHDLLTTSRVLNHCAHTAIAQDLKSLWNSDEIRTQESQISSLESLARAAERWKNGEEVKSGRWRFSFWGKNCPREIFSPSASSSGARVFSGKRRVAWERSRRKGTTCATTSTTTTATTSNVERQRSSAKNYSSEWSFTTGVKCRKRVEIFFGEIWVK